jgi:hypothetical protein
MLRSPLSPARRDAREAAVRATSNQDTTEEKQLRIVLKQKHKSADGRYEFRG